MNETHDPALRSFVGSANATDADFTLQNLPFGVFLRAGEPPRGGVAIGDQIVDLAALHDLRVLGGEAAEACAACLAPTLNVYLALGARHWRALRLALSRLLRADAPHASDVARCLVPQSEAQLRLPIQVGDYTDFYTSIHHATRVGQLFRPDQPLLPNYKWLPVAYHGRSSSVVVSDTPVRRPVGQRMAAGDPAPRVAASARLDYELELGVVIGAENELGTAIAIDDVHAHVYGLCLLNDWSARDIQAWEYQPLGPFAGKNFATTLSPWLVSLEALEPYRVPFTRPHQDPSPLPYLDSAAHRAGAFYDVVVETYLRTGAQRALGVAARRLARTNYRDSAYWSLAQMVAHHTLNGCPLRPGDVLGTGTLSGETRAEAGCLLELSEGGAVLCDVGGEPRTFLEDGDEVELRAYAARPGAARVGFGSARGVVVPADHWVSRRW